MDFEIVIIYWCKVKTIRNIRQVLGTCHIWSHLTHYSFVWKHTENLDDLSKIVELVSGKTRIKTRVCLSSKTVLFPIGHMVFQEVDRRILLSELDRGNSERSHAIGFMWAVPHSLTEWIFRRQRAGKDHWKNTSGLNVFESFVKLFLIVLQWSFTNDCKNHFKRI